jgi:hypothetical protein
MPTDPKRGRINVAGSRWIRELCQADLGQLKRKDNGA